MRHGREICDRRYGHVDNAAEEGKQLPGGLQSEKHLAEVVKEYDRHAEANRKQRDPTTTSRVNGPFVHNLPKKKPVYRKVFTFKGIQSTHSVTHRIKEGKVYNNVYPDVTTDSGLVLFLIDVLYGTWRFEEIPISLRRKEKRPASQLQTKSHAKRKAEKIGRRLKKTKRVHKQRKDWEDLEQQGLRTDPKWKWGPWLHLEHNE